MVTRRRSIKKSINLLLIVVNIPYTNPLTIAQGLLRGCLRVQNLYTFMIGSMIQRDLVFHVTMFYAHTCLTWRKSGPARRYLRSTLHWNLYFFSLRSLHLCPHVIHRTSSSELLLGMLLSNHGKDYTVNINHSLQPSLNVLLALSCTSSSKSLFGQWVLFPS